MDHYLTRVRQSSPKRSSTLAVQWLWALSSVQRPKTRQRHQGKQGCCGLAYVLSIVRLEYHCSVPFTLLPSLPAPYPNDDSFTFCAGSDWTVTKILRTINVSRLYEARLRQTCPLDYKSQFGAHFFISASILPILAPPSPAYLRLSFHHSKPLCPPARSSIALPNSLHSTSTQQSLTAENSALCTGPALKKDHLLRDNLSSLVFSPVCVLKASGRPCA